MTAAILKKKLRDHLALFFAEQALAQWFDPLLLSLDTKTKELRVSFPHAFFGQWFQECIRPQFEQHAVAAIAPLQLTYEGQNDYPPLQESAQHTATTPSRRPAEKPLHKGTEPEAAAQRKHNAEQPAPAAGEEGQQPALFVVGRIPLQDHTFASFLVNKKNDFPLAAAKEAVSNIRKPQYTPFVVFGHSGSGKTHLLEAMINAITSAYSSLRVFYGDAEEFMAFAKASAGVNTPGGIQGYFIDDAQRLFDAGPSLQKQAASYLDTLYRHNKAVILCMDASPAGREGILPQLRQRLTSGLVVKLKKPDVHVRRLYVQQMNTEFHLGLTKGQALSLAQNVTDFRTIIGTLTRIKAYKLLVKDETPDIEHIINTLGSQNCLTPQGIVRCVAEYCGTSEQQVTGTARTQSACTARHYAMYLCRELLGFSLVQVGRFFGGRDHSSVVYSIKKIKSLLASNNVTHNELSTLKQMCLTRAGEMQEDG